jgi:hypothetical protein
MWSDRIQELRKVSQMRYMWICVLLLCLVDGSCAHTETGSPKAGSPRYLFAWQGEAVADPVFQGAFPILVFSDAGRVQGWFIDPATRTKLVHRGTYTRNGDTILIDFIKPDLRVRIDVVSTDGARIDVLTTEADGIPGHKSLPERHVFRNCNADCWATYEVYPEASDTE